MKGNIMGALMTAYGVGAIPLGYIIARIKGVRDIREHGSGNIGATNVSRVLGRHYFLIIFLLDAGKAFALLYFFSFYFSKEYLYMFALLLIFGNGYSIFLQGTGGKGVATMCGLLAILNWHALILFLVGWLSVLGITRTVGIASVIGALTLPLYGLYVADSSLFLFLIALSLWVVWTHRSNIANYWKI